MKKKKPSYKGTQQNLYTLARKAWGYCLLYIIDLALKDAKYTASFVTTQLALVDTVEALPDYETRKEAPAVSYDDLQKSRLELLDEWQFLKGYTNDTYVPPILKVKLESAGLNNYKSAMGGSLDSVASLANSAKTFMAANASDLTTKGGMPAGFPTAFNAKADGFKALRNIYDNKSDTKDTQTISKDEGDAAILATLRPMLRLGSRVFRRDEAKRVKFVYNRLLDEVRGNSDAGLKGIFTDADTKKPIKDVLIRAIDTDYETLSDKDGRFFLKMASGEYTVEITAPGYETMTFYKRHIDIGTKHRFSQKLMAVPTALMSIPSAPNMTEMLKNVPVGNGQATV